MKYLKTFVKYAMIILITLWIGCAMVRGLGLQPEYVEIARVVGLIYAAWLTFVECYEPKHNEG